MSKTKFYRIWVHMKRRCNNPNRKDFKSYGGRGIKICKEWERFENFHSDMFPSYESHLELERKDNNGNYSPKNCRWVTHKEQMNNTSRNVFITFKGKTKTISEWSDFIGIKQNTLYTRIFKYKWSIKKALTKKPQNASKKLLTPPY